MVPVEHRTLLVQGLTPQISDEVLELYFENPKCGGGEIESIYREDEDRARVVFKDDLGKTRMHSSRMRIVRCCSRLLGGGVVVRCLPGGVSAQGRCLPGGEGICLGGCVWQTPPHGQNARQV